ncbi:hypothetical protein [Aquisphaera insulae]|uniref:hypothetical protein n=1 Tax=Aquisphaera insulae TaxID=2712864 RepID=UPI0013EB8B20|nr:hypothetical protein [Aquisphaera insulae]
MVHFVTLERLPDGLEFPGDLKDRIWIDPESRKLYYRGYMSKTDFDRVSGLTRDWSFRRKLEELFQISIVEDEPKGPVGHGLLSLFRKKLVHS